MLLLQKFSLRQQLMLLAMIGSGIGLILVCAGFLFLDLQDYRAKKAQDLELIGNLLAADSSAALEFEDAAAGDKIVKTMRLHRGIRSAILYAPNGKVFALYVRQDLTGKFLPPSDPAPGIAWHRDSLSFAETVKLEEKPVGTLYLEADLADVRSRLIRFISVDAVMVLVCLLIVYILSSRLSRSIVRPIYNIAWTARLIAAAKNYSLRAPSLEVEELKQLGADFNHMLDEIERRDAALSEAQESLEKRVAERTSELTREIAEREHSEARTRAILECALDCIITIDDQGRILEFNPAAEKVFGYSRKEILGKNLAETIIPRAYREAHRQGLARQLATGEGKVIGRRVELSALRADGSEFPIELAITRFSQEGSPLFTAYLRDITERRGAEERLREAKEAAEAANRAKSEFLANMSHEIRTPMNGVLGMTGLALDTELTGEQREYLGMVKSSAEALLDIINDVLDFSKIEAGRLELETTAFSLPECIEDALKPLSLRAQQKGIELTWEVSAGVPDRLRGDPTRLRQILVNLIGNGIKFTPAGEVSVHARLADQSEHHVDLQFTVSDTGIGISAEKHKEIFQAFAQADMSTTRTYGGTGLGLSISARLVELMGGRIWLESEVGRGSKFHFLVRLQKAAGESGAAELLRGRGNLGGRPVLAVDDNPVNRRLLEQLLKGWGMEPVLAQNGREALRIFLEAQQRSEPFPVVILDLQMPGMDGFQVAEELRKAETTQPPLILLLSSAPRSEDRERCQRLGIVCSMVKPIRRESLREALTAALGQTGASPGLTKEKPEAGLQRSLRILLAEDNPVNQKLAARMLEKLGHRVEISENGREAVERVSKESFDLVFMDVQMPVMGGIEATQQIRENERHTTRRIPILAMTAHAMKGDKGKCLEAGMDGYVTKPIRMEVLQTEMSRVLKSNNPQTAPPETPAELEVRPLDSPELLARVGGDGQLLAELLALFREDYPQQLQQLREGLAQKNFAAVECAGHALKGALANLSARPARELAGKLEAMGHAQNLGSAQGVLDQLEKEMKRVVASIEALCQEVTLASSHRG